MKGLNFYSSATPRTIPWSAPTGSNGGQLGALARREASVKIQQDWVSTSG